jgi:hypothetical protein
MEYQENIINYKNTINKKISDISENNLFFNNNELFLKKNTYNNNINSNNINNLKLKFNNLTDKINFVNKHSILIDDDINNDINLIINKLDLLLNKIDGAVINNAKISNKNIQKIIEYDF